MFTDGVWNYHRLCGVVQCCGLPFCPLGVSVALENQVTTEEELCVPFTTDNMATATKIIQRLRNFLSGVSNSIVNGLQNEVTAYSAYNVLSGYLWFYNRTRLRVRNKKR